MSPDNLLQIASFTPNSLETPKGWVGHLPFAAWVMKEVSPKIFVELGTHSGNSYFAFCQSVLEHSLTAKCFAVDTWQGDEHAGHYNEDVFNKVNAHNQERYVEFSQLLRMTFDDATGYFADQSIELLHIDGLHTYEAIAHDFETWLPKLAPDAVVMFHDTNVREGGFGVWKFWEELQDRYPNNLEFVQSHGLGVLQINAPSSRKKSKNLNWLKSNEFEKKQLVKYFAVLGLRQIERYELNDLKNHVTNLEKVIANLNNQIVNFSQTVQERDVNIAAVHQVVFEREEQLAGLNQAVQAKTDRIGVLEAALQERDVNIAAVHQVVVEREEQLAGLNQAVQAKTDRIGVLEAALQERDVNIAAVHQVVVEREEQLSGFNKVLQDKAMHIGALENGIRLREKQIKAFSEDIQDNAIQFDILEIAVQERNTQIDTLSQVLADHKRQLASITSSLTEKSLENEQFKTEKNQLTDFCVALMRE
jgi:predicted  nucleic acid-binding Zn-ribbon protein